MSGPRRACALLLTGPPATGACPPGVDPDTFAAALAGDIVDVLDALTGIDAVIATSAGRAELARSVAWSTTSVTELPDRAGPLDVMSALAAAGYDQAAVVAPDVPDLPGLVIAKPFSALSSRLVAAAPAAPDGSGGGTGLAVLASRLPVPAWLHAAGVSLDTPDAMDRLRGAVPRRRDLAVTAAWRRLRAPADLAGLDPGLEGWEATRALLSGSGRPGTPT